MKNENNPYTKLPRGTIEGLTAWTNGSGGQCGTQYVPIQPPWATPFVDTFLQHRPEVLRKGSHPKSSPALLWTSSQAWLISCCRESQGGDHRVLCLSTCPCKSSQMVLSEIQTHLGPSAINCSTVPSALGTEAMPSP